MSKSGGRQQGRVQVVRCAPEAIRRRRAGETLGSIYDDLFARGDITVAYRTFTGWVTRLEAEPIYEAGPGPSSSSAGRSYSDQRETAAVKNNTGASRRADVERKGSASKQPKKIGMGVPIPSPLDSEPDCGALFGEEK